MRGRPEEPPVVEMGGGPAAVTGREEGKETAMDYTYAQIAEAMEMPVDSVETRLVRARRMLREALKGGAALAAVERRRVEYAPADRRDPDPRGAGPDPGPEQVGALIEKSFEGGRAVRLTVSSTVTPSRY